jgi:hypothetical protein
MVNRISKLEKSNRFLHFSWKLRELRSGRYTYIHISKFNNTYLQTCQKIRRETILKFGQCRTKKKKPVRAFSKSSRGKKLSARTLYPARSFFRPVYLHLCPVKKILMNNVWLSRC